MRMNVNIYWDSLIIAGETEREKGVKYILVLINLSGSRIPETICTGWNHKRNNHCQSKGWTSQAVAWGTNLWGVKCHWNIWECGANKLRFPQAEEFVPKYSAIWARSLKSACQPCPRSKMFIQYFSFKECKIISLPGAQNYWTARGALTFGTTVDQPVSESRFRLKCMGQVSTPQKQLQPCILMRFYVDIHHVTFFLTPC
jgi:hypothetical protein